MKKLLPYLLSGALFSITTVCQAQGNRVPRQEGNYKNEAETLRKEHLTPRHDDTVKPSQTDRMPNLKSDTNRSKPNMPVAEPRTNDHMPVKELSDTAKSK
jgi:hypothetical protein